jgi:hypothetical protein
LHLSAPPFALNQKTCHERQAIRKSSAVCAMIPCLSVKASASAVSSGFYNPDTRKVFPRVHLCEYYHNVFKKATVF